MLRNETLRRRRRRAAAIAVLSIALGSALFMPLRRPAPPHRDGAAYAAIAARPASAEPLSTPPFALRLSGTRTMQPRVQPFPRAEIDYTPTAEAEPAGNDTALPPVALAALDSAPASGGYFVADPASPAFRASGGGFARGGGALPGAGVGGGGRGGTTTPGDTVPTPPDADGTQPAPAQAGTVPATTQPAPAIGGTTPTDAASALDVPPPEAGSAAPAPPPTPAPPPNLAAVNPEVPSSGATIEPEHAPLPAPAPAAARPSHDIGAVPEPETWVLLIIGFGATGAAMRRRRRARALA